MAVAGRKVSRLGDGSVAEEAASSFRGLRLGQTPFETIEIIHREFPTSGIWWSGNTLELWYSAARLIASIRFDENERTNKFEFSPAFFGSDRIHTREFADSVFEHYRIGPIDQKDDLCFSQSTCFQGTSQAKEFFLIFTITGEVQFHVFAPRHAQ